MTAAILLKLIEGAISLAAGVGLVVEKVIEAVESSPPADITPEVNRALLKLHKAIRDIRALHALQQAELRARVGESQR
jgi:VIT1/CCC1 family predicted Fe2+/Mn2+ transporter